MTATPDSSGPPAGPIPGQRPEAVGFLLSQLGYEVASRFGRLMAEVEIEPRQFAVMRAIQSAQGSSQNAVGESLRIPASSMVGLVDQLEARGLVERRAHPTDRRSRTLHMTAEGAKTLDQATALAMGLEETICEGFDPDVRAGLLDQLVQITENLGLVQGVHPGVPDHQKDPHAS